MRQGTLTSARAGQFNRVPCGNQFVRWRSQSRNRCVSGPLYGHHEPSKSSFWSSLCHLVAVPASSVTRPNSVRPASPSLLSSPSPSSAPVPSRRVFTTFLIASDETGVTRHMDLASAARTESLAKDDFHGLRLPGSSGS
jgi:hypothetical protein